MATVKRKKRNRLVIVSITVLILAAGGVYGYLRWKREPVITVQTEKATRRNLTELVVANGRIQPVLQVKISPEVSGEIIELPVKEGQLVKKGDLLMKIKPDYYNASRRSAEAAFKSAASGKDLAEANLRKAQAEFKRTEELFANRLVSESTFVEAQTALEVGQASFETSKHQVNVAKAALDRASEDLAKTTIYSPLSGTVSKLNSQLGERVVGTAMMTGTEVMIIADLNEMEARVDIGEVDVVLIAPGQVARLEVDAFREQKFSGVVTEIANSSKGAAQMMGGGGGGNNSQEATKFEVKVRVNEKELFRPGMSVTAEIETRYRTNVLSVPIQSVTTRLPKASRTPGTKGLGQGNGASDRPVLVADSSGSKVAPSTESPASGTQAAEVSKPVEVIFAVQGERVVMVPVKRGISDDSYMELIDGASEGQEIVSGGYKAVSRELEDGKRIKRGAAKIDPAKEKSRS
jgi:HlyD family secretion protein